MADLNTNLRRRAVAWAGQLTSKAKAYAPTHLQPFIHTKVEPNDAGFILRLGVENKAPTGPGHPNYGSSDARAQEYGSGKQAQRGARTFINIDPVTKPALVFPGTHEWEGLMIITPHVNHPGIKAANEDQGYLRPAVKDLRARLRAELQEDVRDAIKTSMRIAFRGFNK